MLEDRPGVLAVSLFPTGDTQESWLQGVTLDLAAMLYVPTLLFKMIIPSESSQTCCSLLLIFLPSPHSLCLWGLATLLFTPMVSTVASPASHSTRTKLFLAYCISYPSPFTQWFEGMKTFVSFKIILIWTNLGAVLLPSYYSLHEENHCLTILGVYSMLGIEHSG